jgi:hypothetical protein
MRLIAILFAAVLSCTAHAATPTVAELLASHAKAIGALDKVQSRRVRLRVIDMAPFEIPVTIEAKRPNLIRKEVALQGSVQVSAYDGADAWKTDPFIPGGMTPAAMPADEARALVEEADFDGALVNPAAKGNRIAYVGAAEAAGKPAHALRVTLANGNEAVVYLDAATFLELRRVQTRPIMGKPMELEIVSSDYRLVEGVRMPHRIEIGAPGAKQRMAIVIDAVELNVAVDVQKFRRPARAQ